MRVLTEALRNQFLSTFHMARVLADVCPDSVWAESFHGVPFWQQVFHFVFYADYWLRDDYATEDFRCMVFDDAYTTDLYAESYDGLLISRQDMGEYMARIERKVRRLFDRLDDQAIASPVPREAFPFLSDGAGFTFADVITGQIRHIMYNVGYLNGILRERGLPEADWYAYNEPKGS